MRKRVRASRSKCRAVIYEDVCEEKIRADAEHEMCSVSARICLLLSQTL